jgi:hypothetical protein
MQIGTRNDEVLVAETTRDLTDRTQTVAWLLADPGASNRSPEKKMGAGRLSDQSKSPWNASVKLRCSDQSCAGSRFSPGQRTE